MAKADKKSSLVGTIIFVVLVAAVVIGIYMSVTRSKDSNAIEANVEVTEASTLISRDLKNNYPATVREVMKYYCRITQCLYSDELSDSEVEKLVDKIRELYSDELLKENDRDTMLGLARGEIKNYRSNKKTIQSYNVAESGEITYYRNETPARAVINIYFTIKEDNYYVRAYEEFVLVQDSNENWKILGWRLSEE